MPKKSKLMRVKKKKEESNEEEEPIEVPKSEWTRVVRQETQFEKEFPEFHARTCLRNSLSF